MRAYAGLLALASLFVIAGCGTPRRFTAPAELNSAWVLNRTEDDLAEALAHYSQGLIAEEDAPGTAEALREFRLAAEHDPTNVVLQLRVAAGYLGRRDFAQAIAVLEQARRVQPDVPPIRLLLGLAYQSAGDSAHADREYRAAIKLQPTKADGYVRLASLRLAQNQTRQVFELMDRALERVEDPLPILQFYEAVGRLCLINNQPKDALVCFQRIAAKVPENMGIRELLARAYATAGDRPHAFAILQEMARAQPDNWQTYYFLGELAEEMGDLPRASEYFLKASRTPPPQAASFLRLAFLQLGTDSAKALATLQEGLRVLPAEPGIRTYLGLVYSHMGRFADAIQQFREAEQLIIKSDGKDQNMPPLFYFWYGSACEQAGQLEEGERKLERCLELHPETHEALNYLAYMWADRGVKLDKAFEYVNKALALVPNDGAYIDTLAWIEYRRGDYPNALQHLRKACDLLPNDPTISDHMGDVLHAFKKDSQAVDYWKRSFRLDPSSNKVADKLRPMGVDIEQLRREAAAPGKRPK
jgi:tetratricopeptide (TPR) repeat protein